MTPAGIAAIGPDGKERDVITGLEQAGGPRALIRYPGPMVQPSRAGILTSVSALTAAMMMFEVLQTVTLSLQVFAQNAFFVVSVSLLGLGFGGSVATWLTARRSIDARAWMWGCALLFGVSLAVCGALISRTFSPPLLIVATVPPFALAGLFLAILFSSWPALAGRSYFFDLAGSALGCVAIVLLLDGVGDAAALVSAIAALGCASSVPLAAGLGRARLAASLAVTVAVAASALVAPRLYPFTPNPSKHHGTMLANPNIETNVEWSRWSYLGRLDVVRPGRGIEGFIYGGGARAALAAGAGYRFLFASGDNWSYAIDFAGKDGYRQSTLRRNPAAAPYAAVAARDVLVIGVGGGIDLFMALQHGVRSVTAAEINPLMLAAARGLGKSFWDGAFSDPRVTIHELDGRTLALTGRPEQFDVITLTAVDTGAGLSHGGLVLSENYLYTVEAFAQYLTLLRPGGAIFVLRPQAQLLRTVTTCVEALRARGATAPERHIAVFGSSEWISALMFRDPITPEQAAALTARLAAGDLGGKVVYLPGTAAPPGAFGDYFAALGDGREAQFLAAAPLDVSPLRDDRPFFYHQARSFAGSPAGVMLKEILSWVGLIAALLLFVPLLAARMPMVAPRAVSALLYFAGIGAGFMFVEISLMQKLALYLGHPAYSVSVTLFGMLIFSGLGSLSSSRLPGERALWLVIPAVAALIAAQALGLGALLDRLPFAALAPRLVVALAAIAPASFLMGMCFPTKVRAMAVDAPLLIPWAWAVNAFASVMASTGAMVLALNHGFTVVLLVGAGCYAVALLGLRSGRGGV